MSDREAAQRRDAQRGFTLLELTIALTLLALLSAVLFGSLRLAGRSTDSGEAKVEAVAACASRRTSCARISRSSIRCGCARSSSGRCCSAATRDELRYAADAAARASPVAASGTTGSPCAATTRARR